MKIKLTMSHLDRKAVNGTLKRFVVLLIEAAEAYVKNRTKSIGFYLCSFHRLGEQLLKSLHDLRISFNKLSKPSFLALMNEKLAQATNERM